MEAINYLLSAAGRDKKDVASDNPFINIGFDENNARLGWVNPPDFSLISEEVRRILPLLEGKKFFVFVGMGGSINGIKSIASFSPEKAVYTLDSLDPSALSEVLNSIEPDKTLVVAVSKSSTTKETQLIAKSLKQVISEENFVWLIDLENKERLLSFGWKDANIFPIQPDGRGDIGGRFSSPHTLIFLLPLFIIVGRDTGRLKNIWDEYLSLQEFLLKGAYDLADKYREADKAYFNPQVKEDFKNNLRGWLVQLLNESLGSKKQGLAVKTLVSGLNGDEKGFFSLRLDKEIENPLVYIMANMYFFQCFTAFYAYFNNIVFVNQPYVEVYKKAMRSQQAYSENKPPVFLQDIPGIIKENPGFSSKKFIEIILYFSPGQGFVEKISSLMTEEFSDKKVFVFIGSDWNHHSYQAAFKSEDTLYVIVCLEQYKNCPYISRDIIQDNINTLKTISFATFSTLKSKAVFFTLKTLL